MLVAALPDSAFLPAPLWLITALHVLTLTLHFLAMSSMELNRFSPAPTHGRAKPSVPAHLPRCLNVWSLC